MGCLSHFKRDEHLFRLIFETQIHIQIQICYFKLLPIATYYLTTIHIKYLYLHSRTYKMGLKRNWQLTSLSRCGLVNLSTPNFREYQSDRYNNKFDCCFEIQPKTVARIPICTLKPYKLSSNQTHISCQFPVVAR